MLKLMRQYDLICKLFSFYIRHGLRIKFTFVKNITCKT